jgi:hypothetical protein
MTSARMVRLAGILLLTGAALAGLNACSAPGPGTTAPSATRAAVHDGICRVGPDGAPPVDAAVPGLKGREADRGIGGTGAPAEVQVAIVTADRGIGGTGIIGVVTGFASICVDGLEVAYDATSAVDIEGTTADPSQVRVGEVVAIEAVGSPAASITFSRPPAASITFNRPPAASTASSRQPVKCRSPVSACLCSLACQVLAVLPRATGSGSADCGVRTG